MDRKDELTRRTLSDLNELCCGMKQVTTDACLAGYVVSYDG